MSHLVVHQFPCLNDNYGFLLHAPNTGETATIDTPEVAPILRELDAKGWTLTHILNTHHHFDHAGGNQELKTRTGCTVIGPKDEADKIPGLDRAVGDGDEVAFGGEIARVIGVPGHTLGHIAYHFAGQHLAFVGDTLFALGCGRVFEGSPQQMWASLQKLTALPDETVVYCAHEYTQANAKFALTVEPGNEDLHQRARLIDEKRRKGQPTVPTTIGMEKATNPFLRPASGDLQRTIGLEGADLVDVFTKTRALKDNF